MKICYGVKNSRGDTFRSFLAAIRPWRFRPRSPNMGRLYQDDFSLFARAVYSRNSLQLHKPPGTGSQVTDGIHFAIVYGRLCFVWTYPMIAIEMVSLAEALIKLCKSAKMETYRTEVGLSGVVRVLKCSMSFRFLSSKSHSETSACMVSLNFQLQNLVYIRILLVPESGFGFQPQNPRTLGNSCRHRIWDPGMTSE